MFFFIFIFFLRNFFQIKCKKCQNKHNVLLIIQRGSWQERLFPTKNQLSKVGIYWPENFIRAALKSLLLHIVHTIFSINNSKMVKQAQVSTMYWKCMIVQKIPEIHFKVHFKFMKSIIKLWKLIFEKSHLKISISHISSRKDLEVD